MEEMRRIVLSSCQIFFRTPGVALLLRVARLERHDFRMKRTEDSVSLAIGSEMVLQKPSHFGDVEVCSKQLSSSTHPWGELFG